MSPERARHRNRSRSLREDLGVTPEQLAECIGVSAKEIRRIEGAEIDDIKIGALRAHAKSLGFELSISAVLGGRRVRIG
ncbi:helix-turn-helix domain-containing protein [Rathayibacter toxicus]|uniref:helix-turn-helix domain-containing protein n=1 Tax=Rathayibacter toxicus TaxID=145458 RepID=UPI00138AB55C|nr:helix-turn-helix transcriptional regulator [Rathayibacter toxicus]QOD08249.1 helix-turn-helix domain-containing protein [Rathayibacter toxicus]QOD10349.1 helix-turn-helix domain-containing protein [Rathayibacter toxicus]